MEFIIEHLSIGPIYMWHFSATVAALSATCAGVLLRTHSAAYTEEFKKFLIGLIIVSLIALHITITSPPAAVADSAMSKVMIVLFGVMLLFMGREHMNMLKLARKKLEYSTELLKSDPSNPVWRRNASRIQMDHMLVLLKLLEDTRAKSLVSTIRMSGWLLLIAGLIMFLEAGCRLINL